MPSFFVLRYGCCLTFCILVQLYIIHKKKSAVYTALSLLLMIYFPLCLLARLRRISAFILADAELCCPVI